MQKIYFIYSNKHTGDAAQFRVMAGTVSQLGAEVHEISADSINDGALPEFPSDKFMLYAIGEKGITALKKLQDCSAIKDNIFVALGVHQYMSDIKDLALDFLTFPRSTLVGDITHEDWLFLNKTPKVLTFSVPSSYISDHSLNSMLQADQALNKLPTNAKYIIVILPGDAPDIDGKIKYFDEISSKKLADNISLLWSAQNHEHQIIVHNGPRTGKYNVLDESVECEHIYDLGLDPTTAVDKISKSFINFLAENRMPATFLNFAFERNGDNKKTISHYYPLLALAKMNDENDFITPGESVSMLGETTLYLRNDHNVAFIPSSSNIAHQSLVNEAYTRSYLSYFDPDGKIISPVNLATQRDASEDISIIIERLKIEWDKFLTNEQDNQISYGQNIGFDSTNCSVKI